MKAQNYAEAQVYATLMLTERMPGEPVSVTWAGWEDHASRIGGEIAAAISQAAGR